LPCFKIFKILKQIKGSLCRF